MQCCLSTVLAGNVFAADFTTGGGIFSFFGSIYNAVISFASSSPCEEAAVSNDAGRRNETEKEIADRLNKDNRMFSFPANNKPVHKNWLVALSRPFRLFSLISIPGRRKLNDQIRIR